MYCPECSQDKESKDIGLCGECYQALKKKIEELKKNNKEIFDGVGDTVESLKSMKIARDYNIGVCRDLKAKLVEKGHAIKRAECKIKKRNVDIANRDLVIAEKEKQIEEYADSCGALWAFVQKISPWSESNDMPWEDEVGTGIGFLLQRAEEAEAKLAEKEKELAEETECHCQYVNVVAERDKQIAELEGQMIDLVNENERLHKENK